MVSACSCSIALLQVFYDAVPTLVAVKSVFGSMPAERSCSNCVCVCVGAGVGAGSVGRPVLAAADTKCCAGWPVAACQVNATRYSQARRDTCCITLCDGRAGDEFRPLYCNSRLCWFQNACVHRARAKHFTHPQLGSLCRVRLVSSLQLQLLLVVVVAQHKWAYRVRNTTRPPFVRIAR